MLSSSLSSGISKDANLLNPANERFPIAVMLLPSFISVIFALTFFHGCFIALAESAIGPVPSITRVAPSSRTYHLALSPQLSHTVTSQVSEMPGSSFADARIVAVPTLTGVIPPLSSTVTIAALEVSHTTS